MLDNEIQNIESFQSYSEVVQSKQDKLFNDLQGITIKQSILAFLSSFDNQLTQKNYQSALNQLVKFGLIQDSASLQTFALINHNNVIDQIKLIPGLSEASKQARAAAYISLTSFLSRQTEGMIKKAIPTKEKGKKTFKQVRDKVLSEALSEVEYKTFFSALQLIDKEVYLIALLLLHGSKRRSEVLSLKIDQINFDQNQINFIQSKVDFEKVVTITFPQNIMNLLKMQTEGKTGKVFSVNDMQLCRKFDKASKVINLKVTPHMLRSTSITILREKGYSYQDIKKVSGHSSTAMVEKYDKEEQSINLSSEVNFF